MNDVDYRAVLGDTLRKMATVRKEMERLDIEVAKLRQFFFATLNMLPENQKAEYMSVFRQVNESLTISEAGLKDAIYTVLRQAFPEYLIVAEVRDRLLSGGFNFDEYTANPLASVSTTLRRMKPDEVETTTIEGVTAYRSKRPIKRMFAPRGRFNTKRLGGRYNRPGYGGPPVTEDT